MVGNKTRDQMLSKIILDDEGRRKAKAWQQILRFRKEAHGTAQVLRFLEKHLFHDAESMKNFFYTEILSGQHLYYMRKTRTEMEPIFQAWKPFLKGLVSNRKDFVNIVEFGLDLTHKMRLEREKAKEIHFLEVMEVTIYANNSRQNGKNTDHEEVVVKVILDEVDNRLIYNKGLSEWLGKIIAPYLTQKLFHSSEHYYKANIDVFICKGKLTITLEEGGYENHSKRKGN